MSGKEIKEAVDQIKVPENLQEEILANIPDRMKARRKMHANRKQAILAAAVMVMLGCIVGVPTRAAVKNLMQARLEKLYETDGEEIQKILDGMGINAYTRPHTPKELQRFPELRAAYRKGEFPKRRLKQVERLDEAVPGELCYVKEDNLFILPDRDMTDEELLELIDFWELMQYTLDQDPKTQEFRAQYEFRRDKLQERTDADGGLSEEQAIEAARAYLRDVVGEAADDMELQVVLVSNLSLVRYEHTGSTAYWVAGDAPDGSSVYYCQIDSGDGAILNFEEKENEK